jgi:hypothetical protein
LLLYYFLQFDGIVKTQIGVTARNLHHAYTHYSTIQSTFGHQRQLEEVANKHYTPPAEEQIVLAGLDLSYIGAIELIFLRLIYQGLNLSIELGNISPFLKLLNLYF